MAKRQTRGASATTDLATLARAITGQNLGWEAGRTSLSDAKVSETHGFFGLALEPERLAATAEKVRADEAYWGLMGALAPPPSVNWRQKDGADYVKAPRDQGQCQSCVAFAVVGAIEANVRIAHRDPNHFIELSETDLFATGCGPCCNRGWFPDQALKHCQTQGVAARSAVPYKPFDVMVPGGIAGRFRITQWQQLTTRQSIKQAIFEQGPCVYGMVVYDDFFRFYRGGVYRYASGGRLGNHAILIVGYDDAQQCWIGKNSWGTDWGESGFFRIHYDDTSFFGSGYAFPAFSLKVPGGVPQPVTPAAPQPGVPVQPTPAAPAAPPCEQWVPHLKDVIRAAWADPALKAYLRYWVCGLSPQPATSAQFDPLANQVRAIVKQCPNYLEWFCDQLLRTT